MIYFDSNTKEIIQKDDAFDGESLKNGVLEYPDGSEYLLPTNARIEELWAHGEKRHISEMIDELEDTKGNQASIDALRSYRNNLRQHIKTKRKSAERPVRPV